MEVKEQAISESLQDVSVEYTTFGKRLRHIRKERKMTQEAFAELLGTSKQILSRYEWEDRSPRIEVVRKYAEALRVSADYLLGDEEAEAVSSMFWAQKKEKPFYKIFIEVTADKMGLDIPGVVQKTGLTDKQVRTIITRQMKVAPLDLAMQLSDTLNVPLEVWLGIENYAPAEVSTDAYEVARAYDRADIKSKNMVRMALDLELVKEEIALNKYHLKKNGVKIYYVAEAIPDTPEGIILEAVIEGMAAYYSEQLSQNVRRGMKNSAQKGRYTGGTCPLGYTITADKKYEVDPKYAPVVRDIFQLYSEGKTITEIVKILNDRGLRTSRGHAFTHNSRRTVLKNKKYIGTYEYNGEVSIENSVPPIVDLDVFNKVQDLLAFNHKAGAHKKAKVDYILFGKIFCGKCGAGTTGICGTSKQKVKHHYYICSAKKKKLCTKRAVRQDWIEALVLKHLLRLVRNEELLEFIAENTYQYFLAQNTDTTYTKSLQKALEETDRAINNLLRAIEAGIFNESTKGRMNELEDQKKDLRVALAAAKLKEDLALKKEHIVFFLHQFAGMDYSDIDCQKRLIKTFLNSVFVYDDKVVLTFNYSGDNRTITLHEIDGGLGHSICIPSAVVHQKILTEW